MYFQQAIWKPLVIAFATMCGLVVPIALAHAGCLSRLVQLQSSQPPKVRTPLGDSALGAFAPITAEILRSCHWHSSQRSDTEQQVKRLALREGRPAPSHAYACNPGPLGRAELPPGMDAPSQVFAALCLATFHSLNHYHGQWCGRNWATSCGGCFETEPNVCHWSKNASVHVFNVWLFAFVF